MKFLHTADLHIGKAVCGYSMLPDQQFILQKILEICQSERPDAVLIAGDIYDKPLPPIQAVGLFDHFITELSRQNLTVVMVGGNHDSPERIGFAGEILREHHILTPGAFVGKLCCHTIEDEYGKVRIHMLPFIRPAMIRSLMPEFSVTGYTDAMRAVLSTAEMLPDGRNVLVCHQYLTAPGFVPQLGDGTEIVGGAEWIDASLLQDFDYVALGHMHRAQYVGRETLRFSGSPLKYSASECTHPKSVTLAELREKGNISVTALPLTPLRDMRRIQGPLDCLTRPEIAGGGEREDYIHAVLTDETEIINAWSKMKSVYPNLCSLTFNREPIPDEDDLPFCTEGEQLDPKALFAGFFERQNGYPLPQDSAERFGQMLEDTF